MSAIITKTTCFSCIFPRSLRVVQQTLKRLSISMSRHDFIFGNPSDNRFSRSESSKTYNDVLLVDQNSFGLLVNHQQESCPALNQPPPNPHYRKWYPITLASQTNSPGAHLIIWILFYCILFLP